MFARKDLKFRKSKNRSKAENTKICLHPERRCVRPSLHENGARCSCIYKPTVRLHDRLALFHVQVSAKHQSAPKIPF